MCPRGDAAELPHGSVAQAGASCGCGDAELGGHLGWLRGAHPAALPLLSAAGLRGDKTEELVGGDKRQGDRCNDRHRQNRLDSGKNDLIFMLDKNGVG